MRQYGVSMSHTHYCHAGKHLFTLATDRNAGALPTPKAIALLLYTADAPV